MVCMEASFKNSNKSHKESPMTKISINIPQDIHHQIVKIAEQENDSLSYTITRLVEIGLLVVNNNSERKEVNQLEEYCQKLIIQINGIVKELAVHHFNFNKEKITAIANETIVKFNSLNGLANSSL